MCYMTTNVASCTQQVFQCLPMAGVLPDFADKLIRICTEGGKEGQFQPRTMFRWWRSCTVWEIGCGVKGAHPLKGIFNLASLLASIAG